MTRLSKPSATAQPWWYESLKAVAGTLCGTAAIVGVHHCYRKRQHPDATLRDYSDGVRQRLTEFTRPQTLDMQHQYEALTSSSTCKDGIRYHTQQLPRTVRWVSGVASMPYAHRTDKASDSTEAGFGVVGIDAERQLVWQTTMPERVHDIVVQPSADIATRDVVVMGRRPSARFWVLGSAHGQLKHAITAPPHRHFYGHACYSLDGLLLYVSENDTVNLTGKIGVYDAQKDYQKIKEFDAYGIGPHELVMHPDGETLIIANGGIKTEQASREELNLDTMRPALAYLSRHDGRLLEEVMPEHPQMSIRHLDVHDNGRVMIGVQFQGERHLNLPLVLTHQRGEPSLTAMHMPDGAWQRFHQYIASVAVDSARDILCVTTPIGGCAAVFDVATHTFIDSVQLPDCAGASVHTLGDETGFIVSDGQGQLTHIAVIENDVKHKDANSDTDSTGNTCYHLKVQHVRHRMSFDNHLQAVSD
ncbi:DUF1513 domain-containing protein [Psychrobacter aestuarii]|uniref:DUF1513 domain-containing protein n=1 Tax=Psychrobacter aestuarii TaxID=556327 RepID=A0ABN0VTX1_9GAMM|nr:DUF1513 domain-containing protein [Psychrobacter aestuarii]